jgi:cytochrome c
MAFQKQYSFRTALVLAILSSAHFFFVGCNEPDRGKESTQPDSNQLSSKPSSNLDDTVFIAQGKSLFAANCGACHSVFKTDNRLAGVLRRMSESYFKLYLTKQDSLIKAKDKYALDLKESFGHLRNSHNFSFSEEQLNSIIAFLRKYSS